MTPTAPARRGLADRRRPLAPRAPARADALSRRARRRRLSSRSTIAVTPFVGDDAAGASRPASSSIISSARSFSIRSTRRARRPASPIRTQTPNMDAFRALNAQFVVDRPLAGAARDGRLQDRLPPVGRRRPASRSPASNMSPTPTIRAASRISSRTRSSPASPARRAFSTRASSSSTRPARRTSAASASRSWIRTAPMCAI